MCFLEVDVGYASSAGADSFVREGRVLSRSCCMSFSDPFPHSEGHEHEVGTHLIPDKGKGEIAVASSIMTSSAWPKTCGSRGWMYYDKDSGLTLWRYDRRLTWIIWRCCLNTFTLTNVLLKSKFVLCAIS